MSSKTRDVVVIGAGLVGAAAALGLARAGLRVSLVEARRPPPWQAEAEPDLRVFAIAPASRDVLAGLGVWAAIESARAAPYRAMRVWDAATPEAELVFRSQDIAAPELGHIVEQSLIQDRLLGALREWPNVEWLDAAKVSGIEHESRSIGVLLDDGRCVHARLLVAADGAASPLRDYLGIATHGRDYAQRGVVGYIQTGLPHQDTAWQRFQPGGPLAVLPFTEGRSSIVWSLPEAEAVRVLALDDAAFAQALERAFEGRLGSMKPLSARVGFPLHLRLAERYAAERAVLIGDAAHGVHPLAGQGVNLGFQDVAELMQQVGAAQAAGQDIADPLVLARYARRRRSQTTLAAYAFDGIERLFGTNALMPTLLRGPALGMVSRISPLKRFFMRHASGRA